MPTASAKILKILSARRERVSRRRIPIEPGGRVAGSLLIHSSPCYWICYWVEFPSNCLAKHSFASLGGRTVVEFYDLDFDDNKFLKEIDYCPVVGLVDLILLLIISKDNILYLISNVQFYRATISKLFRQFAANVVIKKWINYILLLYNTFFPTILNRLLDRTPNRIIKFYKAILLEI